MGGSPGCSVTVLQAFLKKFYYYFEADYVVIAVDLSAWLFFVQVFYYFISCSNGILVQWDLNVF